MIELELFLNNQSLHGQFRSGAAFRAALDRVMAMRRVARQFERDIHCDGGILSRDASPDVPVQKAIAYLSPDQRRATMQWWTRGGPFWDADRRHGADDWFECQGEIVTDDALGEAAYRKALGLECDTVSFTPSDWTRSPLMVRWRRNEGVTDLRLALKNFWEAAELRARLRSVEPPISSWSQLRERSERHFANLRFGPECFRPLRGLPFSNAGATRIRALLSILDQFAVAFEPDGRRSVEGQRMYQDYFTGTDGNELFSDSSDSEKSRFAKHLEFPHPDKPNETISCTWHGKVSHMFLRIHFSWPVRAGKPVYVMYIGQKITRR